MNRAIVVIDADGNPIFKCEDAKIDVEYADRDEDGQIVSWSVRITPNDPWPLQRTREYTEL
ncbi:hypothetical protein [Mycolicibacterium houstonense]|uniref:hypothetical protein n=1 Tax=Mycolicibacterium houstonense TaxID=146021 RepID=UPI000833C43C|nr:hypothetical protein [Mycolicibacterium houstonense]